MIEDDIKQVEFYGTLTQEKLREYIKDISTMSYRELFPIFMFCICQSYKDQIFLDIGWGVFFGSS
jgi:hypothetical protein